MAAPKNSFTNLLALCRVSNLPTVWMNVLAALVLASAPFEIGTFALLVVSLSAFYCAGMSLNDLLDREHDAEHQPFRPIPSGRISVAAARTTTALLFAVALALLSAAPHASALVPGGLLLAVIWTYDRFHKQVAASVLLMAACRTLVFIVCGWAVTGEVEPLVLAAGSVQFAYTLLVSVVARGESKREGGFGFPLIPRMIAAMALVDGLVLAILSSPVWLVPAAIATLLTHLGQRWVRGD